MFWEHGVSKSQPCCLERFHIISHPPHRTKKVVKPNGCPACEETDQSLVYVLSENVIPIISLQYMCSIVCAHHLGQVKQNQKYTHFSLYDVAPVVLHMYARSHTKTETVLRPLPVAPFRIESLAVPSE